MKRFMRRRVGVAVGLSLLGIGLVGVQPAKAAGTSNASCSAGTPYAIGAIPPLFFTQLAFGPSCYATSPRADRDSATGYTVCHGYRCIVTARATGTVAAGQGRAQYGLMVYVCDSVGTGRCGEAYRVGDECFVSVGASRKCQTPNVQWIFDAADPLFLPVVEFQLFCDWYQPPQTTSVNLGLKCAMTIDGSDYAGG